MTYGNAAQNKGSAASGHDRIGLALSGGGFRASLFHLGVIRRLEELGIMERVSIVSSVSGGSIVGAFYLCEMEKQLRESRIKGGIANRVELFERIAEKFLRAVEFNLRTRALIFTPWYHPIRFLKILFFKTFRKSARAELIQAEYDKFFYSGNTLDQLPVEEPDLAQIAGYPDCIDAWKIPFYGPRLILNTTSLLTGERVSFSRDVSSGINDLKTPDKNALLLSQVVGASSGVPVLFPPTAIRGDLLVDGGVSDNQGIESLLDPANGCNVILVSDASGQMQSKDTVSTSEASVYLRTNEIFQFQIRNKLLDRLMDWGGPNRSGNSFAFIHLLVNLKGRVGAPPRVSTEILPALSRIRTDLDQFSPIECESLMYHGYTLIDAQLKRYCCDFLKRHRIYLTQTAREPEPPLLTPRLFWKDIQEKLQHESTRRPQQNWDPVRIDLEAGSEGVFVLRCLKKHRFLTLPALFLLVGLTVAVLIFMFQPGHPFVNFLTTRILDAVYSAFPAGLVSRLDRLLVLLGYTDNLEELLNSLAHLAATVIAVAFALYLASFPTYVFLRSWAMRLDKQNYQKITGGTAFSVKWTPDASAPESVQEVR